MKKVFVWIQIMIQALKKHKENVQRCNNCIGLHVIGNHGPCENCLNGSNFAKIENVLCGTYNEKCRYGMNCDYCKK